MFHEYEIVFIIRPDIDDAATKEAIERAEATITDAGGQLLERDDWGKRKLAYPINKHTKGHYVLLNIVAPPTLILELERKFRIDDRVIRFLSVKLDDNVDVQAQLDKAAERKAAAAAKAEEAQAAEKAPSAE